MKIFDSEYGKPRSKGSKDEFIEALEKLVNATQDLASAWRNTPLDPNPFTSLATGYPPYLPSYDQFTMDIYRWSVVQHDLRRREQEEEQGTATKPK